MSLEADHRKNCNVAKGFRPSDKFCAKRIALHISEQGQQVGVCLHGDGAVPILVDGTGPERAVRQVPALRMCGSEPVHETWEISARRMHYEVPMVRHDTVREQWDRHAFECLDENALEGLIVP